MYGQEKVNKIDRYRLDQIQVVQMIVWCLVPLQNQQKWKQSRWLMSQLLTFGNYVAMAIQGLKRVSSLLCGFVMLVGKK